MRFLPLAPTAAACSLSHARAAPSGTSLFAQHCAACNALPLLPFDRKLFLQKQIYGRLEVARFLSPQTITGKSYVH
jgi:hypothetical protein